LGIPQVDRIEISRGKGHTRNESAQSNGSQTKWSTPWGNRTG